MSASAATSSSLDTSRYTSRSSSSHLQAVVKGLSVRACRQSSLTVALKRPLRGVATVSSGRLEFGPAVEPSHGNPSLNLVVGTDSWPDLLDARDPRSRPGKRSQVDGLENRVLVASHLKGACRCGKARGGWPVASQKQAWHVKAIKPDRAEPWQKGRRPERGSLHDGSSQRKHKPSLGPGSHRPSRQGHGATASARPAATVAPLAVALRSAEPGAGEVARPAHSSSLEEEEDGPRATTRLPAVVDQNGFSLSPTKMGLPHPPLEVGG
eukprot:scaffold3749_cov119-Isochrysis_galbana.AAC.1